MWYISHFNVAYVLFIFCLPNYIWFVFKKEKIAALMFFLLAIVFVSIELASHSFDCSSLEATLEINLEEDSVSDTLSELPFDFDFLSVPSKRAVAFEFFLYDFKDKVNLAFVPFRKLSLPVLYCCLKIPFWIKKSFCACFFKKHTIHLACM